MFKSNHGGKPIDWAVGAMIYEINQDQKPHMSHTGICHESVLCIFEYFQ